MPRFKRAKYLNTKVQFKGLTFYSKKERDYYIFLLSEKQAGKIKHIKCQLKYELIPKNDKFREVAYFADFAITDYQGNVRVIDVKNPYTRKNDKTYIIKRKLMYHCYKILVEEV